MQFGYAMQPQKLPYFPLRNAIGDLQSGQLGFCGFSRECLAQDGKPASLILVAMVPQNPHFIQPAQSFKSVQRLLELVAQRLVRVHQLHGIGQQLADRNHVHVRQFFLFG